MDKKIPKVKELHSSGIVVGMSVQKDKSIGGILRRKLTSIFKKYDALVLLNQDETHYFEDCKTVVIPNFTDFISNSDENTIKEKIVIAAGRIAPVKRFQELIHIWKLISDDFPEWKVKIFGDGDLKTTENLQKLVNKLNLTSSFFLLPSISTIQDEMQKAAIYAMTSETECFPMVLLEAQVCGLPIVSYDCPNGPRNIINDSSDGFLTPQNDRISFAQKLSELMKNESKRNEMGNNSKQNVKKFSKEKVMPEWDKLFIKLKVKN
jgi:glycosyltransferase involved in cell wall biosynthesis